MISKVFALLMQRAFMTSRLPRRTMLSFVPATTAALAASFACHADDLKLERLDRGIVAIATGPRNVFVSWRLLGTERTDTPFNLYRITPDAPPVKVNDRPRAHETCLNDSSADLTRLTSYVVRAVQPDGKEGPASPTFTMQSTDPLRPYLSVPLQTPAGYSPNDASVADLDGDGRYEIILHQTGRAHDNSHSGVTDPPILQAYTLDGKLLWTISLGRNIRDGAHYTQFLVYDFDGDGRAELICKTSDGTTDGRGKVIGDPNASYANEAGHILKGPELLTVFDGLTGAALATEKYVPARTNNHPEDPDRAEYKALWGDNYGNRGERYLAAVAYLDGQHPSAVMCRGYYGRTALCAWDWRGGKLTQRWLFDTDLDKKDGVRFSGQGNHNLTVADVDGDGKDEIVYGAMVVDDDGKGLCTTGLGHGDAIHVGDLDPTRPGLEVYRIQERFSDAGAHMYDPKTGEILWRRPSLKAASEGGDKGEGPGRGLAADVDPCYPGDECWSAGAGITGMVDARGKKISDKAPPSCNFAIWWDGDDLRELLDKTSITKWDWMTGTVSTLLDAKQFGCRSNNGTKATPTLSADLFGDWREEVIFPTTDGKELRIFTTTIPTKRRLTTLMHDRQYRLSIAWQNVGYNQPPHTSFFLGGIKPKPGE